MNAWISILATFLRGVERWLANDTPATRAHVAQQARFLKKLLEDVNGKR